MKELTSGAGQVVGVESVDAQDVWKSWTKQYVAIMKLREEEAEIALKIMLWDIHGLPISNPRKLDNDKQGTLPGDEDTPGYGSPS